MQISTNQVRRFIKTNLAEKYTKCVAGGVGNNGLPGLLVYRAGAGLGLEQRLGPRGAVAVLDNFQLRLPRAS